MNTTNRCAAAVALALLGTTAAFAQSSVTLYGRVNTTVERQKDGNASVTGLFNNSSRFGFKGVEDLGGGLKAGFQLESGFASDTGVSDARGFFARQSEVNLSGNFGMVRLGRMTPESYYATADYVSMHNHDTGSSADVFYVDPVGWSNKVAYRTPSFGGLTVEGAVVLHEQVSGGKNGYDLAANYSAGGLELGAGYSKVGDANQFALRGLYSFGSFIVGGYYQRSDEVNPFGAGAVGKRDAYRLAAAYMLGASEFHLNVGRAGKVDGIANSSANQYTLGYNYNLSKRTKVYGYYTKVANKAGASYAVSAAGNDFSSFALGVRHNF